MATAPQSHRRARSPRNGPRLPRWTLTVLKLGLALGLLGVVTLAGAFWYFGRDLPSFETLEDYQPLQTTRVVSADGQVVGELFVQRRTVVPFEAIPDVLVHAIVASEDENFFEHEGIDYAGILRAAVKNLLAMRVREGASTITQQTVKTFLLTPERKFSRKFKEMILARRLERNLSKDEILYLYLNQIYFGHGRYGVEEASRYYFGKSVRDLTLAEAATLAGLPKAPAHLSPRRHPEAARRRRAYVLGRMVEAGYIDAGSAEAARAQPVEVVPLPEDPPGGWYVEEVRRRLEVELGSELLLGGGLTVEVGMDARLQGAAERAVRENLEAVDRRQGWRGALARVDDARVRRVRARFATLMEKHEAPVLWDLGRVADWDPDAQAEPPVDLVDLEADARPAGLVTQVDDGAGTATIDLGTARVVLRLSDLKWARPFDPERRTAAPSRISQVLEEGDLVRVRLSAVSESQKKAVALRVAGQGKGALPVLDGALFQRPKVQGAFVAIDPANRHVLALVGGYDVDQSAFNRATQAKRQPGSSFKPFVYGTALDSRRYTPLTPVLDAPEVFRDPWTGKTWKPSNSSGRFDGELPLRTALARSKNVVSVRLVEDLGVDPVIEFAKRAGIRSELPRYMPLALGAGEVAPFELVNAYATLAALGVRDEPVMVLEVRDPDGRVLRSHQPQPEQVIDPEVCWVLMDMMRDVMEEGTGRRLNQLDRPVAGKTGTANDQRDAWFVGITPQVVAGTWVGFDEPRPLGSGEYGARAAGPAWLAFMREAVAGAPAKWFDPPEEVVFVRVDPDSGLLARPGEPGRFAPYVAGTEPTELAPPAGLTVDDYPMLDPELMP